MIREFNRVPAFQCGPTETTSAGKRGHLLKGGRLHRPHGKSMMGKGDGMKLAIRPLTPDLWPALEDLFGVNGAVGGCWCMYWRIGRAIRKNPGTENKAAFREIVEQGPPPGLLAFDGEVAVG